MGFLFSPQSCSCSLSLSCSSAFLFPGAGASANSTRLVDSRRDLLTQPAFNRQRLKIEDEDKHDNEHD
jgi:hypothetical protein